jgi:hypothetical protein
MRLLARVLLLSLLLGTATPVGATQDAPANDNRAAAATVEVGSRTGGNAAAATMQAGEFSPCGEADSVWYRFTAPATGSVQVQARSNDFRVSYYLYEAAADAPVNAETGGCPPMEPFSPGTVRVQSGQHSVTPGHEYLVQVVSTGGAGGPFELELSPASASTSGLGDIDLSNIFNLESMFAELDLESMFNEMFSEMLSGLTAEMFGEGAEMMSADFTPGSDTFTRFRTTSGAAPANDAFGAAMALSLPGRTSGNSEHATAQLDEPRACGMEDATVWFAVTPDRAGNLFVSSAGSDFDTVLAIYTGSTFEDLARITCNDDASFDTKTSELRVPASAGTTYLIQLSGWSLFTPGGAYELEVRLD